MLRVLIDYDVAITCLMNISTVYIIITQIVVLTIQKNG